MTLVILTVAGGAPPTPAVVSGALELQSVRASAPAARFSPARAFGAGLDATLRAPTIGALSGVEVDPSQRS